MRVALTRMFQLAWKTCTASRVQTMSSLVSDHMWAGGEEDTVEHTLE